MQSVIRLGTMGKTIDKADNMNHWKEVLSPEKQKPYFLKLWNFVSEEYATKTIYPAKEDVFNAFKYTELADVKAVIIGQDPYHGPNQAHGLCFSVLPGIKHPPSLRNIFQEYHQDLGLNIPTDGTLTRWAQQGVLMLNTVMTVEQGLAHSHKGKGWEVFTDEVIQTVSKNLNHVVFVLWGNPAQKKIKLIDTAKHTVIKSVHPSPLSAHRGFFGSKPFSQTNAALTEHGQTPIDWSL
jgi:uracil-DNA glycosylase